MAARRPRVGDVASVTRPGATLAIAAATARARSEARIAALRVTGSTSPGVPSTDPVTVNWTRGSRTASLAHPASAAGDVGSVAEPTAKSSMPAAATGRAAGGAKNRGRAISAAAVAGAAVAGAPNPSRNPAASARGARRRSPAVCVACSSTKNPTSSSARSASVISQSGRPGWRSGYSPTITRHSSAARAGPRARRARPAAPRSARVRTPRCVPVRAAGWRSA